MLTLLWPQSTAPKMQTRAGVVQVDNHRFVVVVIIPVSIVLVVVVGVLRVSVKGEEDLL